MKDQALLEVNDLSISFKNETFIKGISFNIPHNTIVGVVGESGSGKSITSLAVLGLLESATITGKVVFDEQNLLTTSNDEFRKIRGNRISMIFQDPMSSLNPSMKCGNQVAEVLINHLKMTKKAASQEVLSLFEKVQLRDPQQVFSKYPHEISGGQKQRVMIAMAIACKPDLLIADEPTTALDVTVQKDIIALLKEIQQETKMSVIFISHDLSLVSEISDEIIVMFRGDIVEQGETKTVFTSPKHKYTKALINSRPSFEYRSKRLATIEDVMNEEAAAPIITAEERKERHKKLYAQEPLLEVVDVQKSYFNTVGLLSRKKEFQVLKGVSFKIYEGETLGLVGESGCGKSTLGNTILKLHKPSHGNIFYKGKSILDLSKEETRQLRREIQLIFQDPYSSLNPRIPIGKAVMEPMKAHGLYHNDEERKEKVMELLTRVGLKPEHFYRYPHEFSGGQRQRVGIARTIAVSPKLIVCDESVSALDISVQAQVLNLLNELKEDFGFTYVFISHDLAVVKYMSDQLLVLNKGVVEELGEADAIYREPKSDYTKKLIDAIPKGL